MPEPEQGDAICIHCGAEVFWGLPLPEDPCFECGKPVAEQGDVEPWRDQIAVLSEALDLVPDTTAAGKIIGDEAYAALVALTTQIEEMERERDGASRESDERGQRFNDAVVRAEKAELALAEIEISEPDWAKGVDENCETLRSIARAALRPSEEASDE